MNFESLLSTFRGGATNFRELGAKAAARFLSEKVASPTAAIIAVMQEEKLGDSPNAGNIAERLVEETNKAIYAVKFKSASYTGNIEFPVAEATEVKKAFAAKASSGCRPVIKESAAAIQAMHRAEQDEILRLMFGNSEKTAGVLAANIYEGDVLSRMHRALDEKRDYEQETIRLSREFDDTFEKLANVLNTDNVPKTVLAGCMQAANPSAALSDLIKVAFGFAPDPRALSNMQASGMPPAPGNPVTGLVQDLDNIGSKMTAAREAMDKTMSGIAELQAILKGSGPTVGQVFSPPGVPTGMMSPAITGAGVPAPAVPPQNPENMPVG